MDHQDFYNKVVQTLGHIYKSKLESDMLDTKMITEFQSEEIKPLFAYKTEQNLSGMLEYERYSCSDVCCNINYGHFCCGGIEEGSKQLNELGLGISLYMKFVCYLVSFFLIATVLIAAPLYMYYQASNQNNSLLMDLNSVLYSSTIGSLTANLYQCSYAANRNQMQFSVSCQVGTINLYQAVYSNKSFVSVQTCQSQIDNSIKQLNKFQGTNITNCTNSHCDITLQTPTLISEHLFVSISYSCLNPQYYIFGYPVQNKIVILVTVAADLLAVIVFVVWMFLQTKSQKKLTQHFYKKQISLDDFTLQLKGLKIGQSLQSQKVSNFLEQLADNVLCKIQKQITISKFKICDSVQKINDQYKKNELYQKLFKKKFEKILAEGKDPTQMTLEQFAIAVEFEDFRKDIENIFEEFKPYLYRTKTEPFSMFITFQTPQMASHVLRVCDYSCFTGKRTLTVVDKNYKIKKAARPDLIQWENISSHYILRTILSWFFTLCILVISYFMIAAAQILQSKILNRFDFKMDCSLLYQPTLFASWNQDYKKDSNWINCYCSSNWGDIFKHSQCQSWLKNYSFYMFSPMFISLLIVIFNMIISFVFKKLSKFQKHSNVINELYSYIIKRALLLILNAGFIIVIVNQKLSVKSQNPFVSFLFGGSYNNFDAAWYYNIGQVIIFTNLFNIVMPVFEVVIRSLFKCLLKMIDTRCCRITTSMSSKQQYKELYSGIPFPIQQRYAEILSLLILTFAYNSVIPILNIVAMLSFIFQYLSDKIMIFYIYRKPPNYDQNLQRKVRKTIILCILIHLITSIFFLPTQGIDWNSGLNLNLGKLNQNSTLVLIASQVYMYPYIFFLGLVVIWIIFRHTIISFFSCCTERCENKQQNYFSIQKNDVKVYNLFTDHQIQQLLKINRAELTKVQDDQQMHNFNTGINQTMETMFMAAAFKLVVNHGDIEIPKNWDQLDNYRKILFEQRAQLKNCERQVPRIKLNGLPGYDPIFAKDTNIVEVSRLEKVIHNFYNNTK